jgi:putative alpha-1,2-mannosidase
MPWPEGLRRVRHHAALQAMVETSTAAAAEGAPGRSATGSAATISSAGIPLDKIDGESVSQTLELGIGDDAVARVAHARGRTDVAEPSRERAQSWRQLWDAQTR